MLLTPDAILFDMDGVIVDSLGSWWKSLNVALKNFRQKEISGEEFITNFWGHDLQDNLKRLGMDQKIGFFCNNIYSEHVDEIKLFLGTKAVLKKLIDYPKAVITNTPKECVLQIFKKFDIDSYFDVIVTSDQVGRGKPAPDIIFEACKRLDVKPKNVVLVGDTDSDVKAGYAAGCTVIGINIDADYTIKNISDLISIIRN
jgi:HAD superfamily hydrolase (TIGR01509 family)